MLIRSIIKHSTRQPIRATFFKYLSTITTNLPYQHNELIRINIPKLSNQVKFTIHSVWKEGCTLEHTQQSIAHIKQSYENNILSIDVTDDFASYDSNIKLFVPEHCNISLKGGNMLLNTIKKIQGDIDIDIKEGTINIEKLRGECVKINLAEGEINVSKVLEGNIKINCEHFKAKMINGNNVLINAIEAEIEAFYSQHAEINTYGDANISLLTGQCKITSDCGNISLSGIDGSVKAHAMQGNITAQINKVPRYDDDSGEFTAIADKGFVLVKIDPETLAGGRVSVIRGT